MNIITKEQYEQALEIIKKFECVCSKCGTQFRDHWEWGHNRFHITVEISSNLLDTLFGDKASLIGFNHPAISKNHGYDHQHCTLVSAKDFSYRLCPLCHTSLVKIIGNFITQ